MHKYPSNIFAYFKTFHPRFHLLLNILFLIYAALLPFSDAFSSHTGPWLLLLFWLLEGNLPKKFRVLLNEKVNVWWLLFLGFSFLSLSWTSNINCPHLSRQLFHPTSFSHLRLPASCQIGRHSSVCHSPVRHEAGYGYKRS
jgi:hypothetical protein